MANVNIDRFRERFGRTPRLFEAPGRINIIGEHTDYTGGFVMPAAIDRTCKIAAAPNDTRFLRIFATAYDAEVRIDLDGFAPRKDWSDYVAGVASVLMAEGIGMPGADIMIESDVPIGAGVSSSAAIEVASACALLALAGVAVDGPRIATWTQAAENRFVGMPCGIMDQFASANGRKGHAMVLDCRSLDVSHVPLPETATFLVINSMVKHTLVDGEYRARRSDCEEAVARLGVASLRDLTTEKLQHADLPDRIARRARHVVSENARVMLAAEALRKGEVNVLGQLMNASHESLRRDMEVSIPEVDRLAGIAQKIPGVLGARLMGGGFGGSVIALVELAQAETARAGIVRDYRETTGKSADAFTCMAVSGAHEVVA